MVSSNRYVQANVPMTEVVSGEFNVAEYLTEMERLGFDLVGIYPVFSNVLILHIGASKWSVVEEVTACASGS